MQLPIQMFVRLRQILRRNGIKYLKNSFWRHVNRFEGLLKQSLKHMVATLKKMYSFAYILLFIFLKWKLILSIIEWFIIILSYYSKFCFCILYVISRCVRLKMSCKTLNIPIFIQFGGIQVFCFMTKRLEWNQMNTFQMFSWYTVCYVHSITFRWIRLTWSILKLWFF